MRIGILGVRSFPPQMSGIDRQMFELSKHLAKDGHEVYIFVAEKGRNSHKRIHLIGIPSIKIETVNFSFSYLTYNLFSVPKVVCAVKKYDIDVLHLNNPPAGLVGLIVKKLTGVPVVYTIRGTIQDNIRARGRIVGKMLALLEKPVIKKADKITVLTEYIGRMTEAYHKRELPIKVIPNGIVSRGRGNAEKIREEFALGKNAKVLLFVGRLVSVKGINYLIAAMETIVREMPKTVLLIVGGGPLRKGLENMVKKHNLERNVIFAGIRNDVENFMAAADVMVLPSLHEGFSNVVLEAMYVGLPMITTRVTSNPDIVKNKFGMLVEPKNPRDISRATLKILRDKKKLSKMSNEAKKESKKYRWSIVTKKFERVYRSIIHPFHGSFINS